MQVGSIVLSAGFTPFNPAKFDNYQYAKLPNVVTSMEFERILSASGPTQGHLMRLSKDGRDPKKIAWFQCVGSRDLNRCDNSYCSSVCCMYAIKEAVIAKEHVGQGPRLRHLLHGHADPRQGVRALLRRCARDARRALHPQPGALGDSGGR